jgi:hypothetical protein
MPRRRPHCHTHREVELVCPRCEQARRGRATSAAKADAARANGRKGGRPRDAGLATAVGVASVGVASSSPADKAWLTRRRKAAALAATASADAAWVTRRRKAAAARKHGLLPG